MKEDWMKVVSFKTELLSEAVIQRGYRESLSKILSELPPFRNRMIIDNDIYVDLNEIKEIRAFFSDNIIEKASHIYEVIEEQSRRLLENTGNLEDFLKQYQITTSLIGIPTIIDIELEEQLKEKLKSELDLSEDFIATIAVPKKTLGSAMEKESLLNVAIKMLEQDLSIDSDEVQKDIQAHYQEYGWIYSTLFLGEEYDIEEITKNLTAYLSADPKQLKNKLLADRRQLQERAEKEISSLASIEVQELARFLQAAIFYRTARLEWMNKACFAFKPRLEAVADQIRVSFEEILYMLPEEISAAYEEGSISGEHRAHIKERIKKYALVSSSEVEYKLLTGDAVEVLRSQFKEEVDTNKEIKGTAVSKGRATGTVAVVKDRSELHKIEEGIILVTPLTTPDFILAMKQAAAIVTDLGGVTSHAAIVSRELKKPCIVGTGNATKVLQDGTMVEVDADTGIVKILDS